MLSDEIGVSLENIEPALDLIENTARYIGFDAEFADRLRLLGEELILSAGNVLDDLDGVLWLDTDSGNMRIHLKLEGELGRKKRNELIQISKQCKNEPPKGLFKRIAAIIDDAFMVGEGGYEPMAAYYGGSPGHSFEYSMLAIRYGQSGAEKDDKPDSPAELEGIENSIIKGLADDVRVSIHGNRAELTIIKQLPNIN